MKRELVTLYHRIRAEERAALEKRTREALRLIPALRELSDARSETLKLVGDSKIDAVLAARTLRELTRQEEEVLVKAGLEKDTLKIHYRCPVCKDTGTLADDRPCACRLQYEAAMDNFDAINAVETFERFRTDIYPDEAQRSQAIRARDFCLRYADALPAPEKPNLLILGTNGLGKSYLSNAIARRAIMNGVESVRITAYRFTQDVLSDIKAGTNNAVRFHRVPLFVLDDLGSEPLIPNVSREWLFAVMNERLLHKRASVIVTNLDYEAIGLRYGERLLSRLVNRSTTTSIRLRGKDLRLVQC